MNAPDPSTRPGAPRSGEIKGIALRNFPVVLTTLRGAAITERVLGALSPEPREAFRSGAIVASGWYPLDWYRELHFEARKATLFEPGLAWQIGRESTKLDLSGVYRIFLRVLSPSFVLSTSTRFFGSYYRRGTMKLVESRPGFGRVTFRGCVGFDAHVWNDVFGGCEVTMELAGARGLRIRVEDGGRDTDVDATVIARWAGGSEEPPPDPKT